MPRQAAVLTVALPVTPALVLALVLGLALVLQGCSTDSSTGNEGGNEGCVGDTASELTACAKGPTISGIDVSVYQGTVSFTKVKAAGRAFVFTRISDGLNSIDSSFPANWPAIKNASLVRGAYQFFRPSQDPTAQAELVLRKLAAAGGLKPGDLPPVLDLETADGVASATVRANALTWLKKIEAATGVKPFVYTAAFMSDVIGTSLGGYTLWVANYGVTCPTVPTGWNNWHFWQDSGSGTVTGVAGDVDTDQFNGTLAELTKLTIPTPSRGSNIDDMFSPVAASARVIPSGNTPNDGSQGATLGSGTPKPDQPNGATATPCD